MRITPAQLACLAVAGCQYEAPINPAATEFPNVITGTVLAGDVDAPTTTLLFLSSADNPMPPSGTGSPYTFSTVSGRDYSSADAGVRSAPYAVTNIPDGEWVLSALMDMDNDFHPGVSTLAGSTCGDLVGGHLQSLDQATFAPIEVEGGREYSDITVALGVELLTERPAFGVVDGAAQVTPSDPLTSFFQLESVGIEAQYGEELSLSLGAPWDESAPAPCATAFWVHLRDTNGDGAIDPHPGYPPELMVPDVWPRIYLSWLGTPTDTDGDGLPDTFDRSSEPEGTTYVSEGIPYAPQLAAIDPTNPATVPPIGTPFPVTTLDVLFPAAAIREDADGSTTTLTQPEDLPAGAWSVTVIAETGQTWTVPNELDTSLDITRRVPPPGVTSPRDPTQGTWVELVP